MTTLTEFLLARVAEDEEIARAAAGWDRTGSERAPGAWRRSEVNSVEGERGPVIAADGPAPSDTEAEHIARQSPARVLAECEAKRRIVRAATEVDDEKDYGYVDELDDGQVWAFGVAMQALALPYADHPDYREEWRP